MLNQQLANELYKPITKLLKHLTNIQYTHLSNIWCADLADMQLISKYNKGIRFLLLLIFIVNIYGLIL